MFEIWKVPFRMRMLLNVGSNSDYKTIATSPFFHCIIHFSTTNFRLYDLINVIISNFFNFQQPCEQFNLFRGSEKDDPPLLEIRFARENSLVVARCARRGKLPWYLVDLAITFQPAGPIWAPFPPKRYPPRDLFQRSSLQESRRFRGMKEWRCKKIRQIGERMEKEKRKCWTSKWSKGSSMDLVRL